MGWFLQLVPGMGETRIWTTNRERSLSKDSLLFWGANAIASSVYAVCNGRQGTLLKEVVTTLRDIRIKNQLKPKEEVKLSIQTEDQQSYDLFKSILAKQVNASEITFVKDPVANSINTVVQKDKFYIETENELDTSVQKEQLLKDLEYQKGFLTSVEKKLSNERFVQNAKPEVVESEKKKKSDAEAKIKAIEESLASL